MKLINLSVSGAKVADVTNNQLPQLQGLKPDLVTIEIGANDIKGFDAVKFEADMKALVTQLPGNTYISDVPAFTGRAQNLQPTVQHANVIIQQQNN